MNQTNGDLIDLPEPDSDGNRELTLNMSTSAAGAVRVEVQDETGTPIPGFTLADSDILIGDSLEEIASWQGKTDLNQLAGRAVRFRFFE